MTAIGGWWDTSPVKVNPDAVPWWGAFTVPNNGYVCGGCGSWVVSGLPHHCRSYIPLPSPVPRTAPTGYTCSCGEFVLHGMFHICANNIASPNTISPETPVLEMQRLLQRLVELLEGQQSTGDQEGHYETVECDEDDEDSDQNVGRWAVWNLDPHNYPEVSGEWINNVHFATIDVDEIRYYFVSPAAAIRAYRQPEYPAFANTPGLVMVKRLPPNE